MSPQQTIGHYRITSKLGEGGMGAVYQATDTRLNRQVALKLLPAAFAADAGRMARFEREAQVLASLNHPNIAAIYAVEQGAIVMELVEGANLAGPVPVETAIGYARQIAAGLEAAHEKGIVHRDLKPANIRITPDGAIKLLDFGLAKPGNEIASALSPTISLALTEAGMILGTVAYMSPEQARGKPVDKRADIWAFGVVLYEMLTGRQPFAAGDSCDPDWSLLPAETPPRLRRLLEQCLRKDPKLRLRDIGDARLTLDEPEPAAPPASVASNRLWIAAICALAVTAGWLATIHFREIAPVRTSIRFRLSAPENAPSVRAPIVSPNGRFIAFATAGPDAMTHVWVQGLDELDAKMLPGTEKAGALLFWSPDSRFLAFQSSGKLLKVDISGAAPETLCTVSRFGGGSWSRNGVIIFSGYDGEQALFTVPAAGGIPVRLKLPEAASRFAVFPSFLPDGRRFLYRTTPGPDRGDIYLGRLDGSPPKKILSNREMAAYSPSQPGSKAAHLIFPRESTLVSQPVDPDTLQFAGDVFSVAALPARSSTYLGAGVSVSENGVLAYRTGMRSFTRLTWFDRSGKILGTTGATAAHSAVELSPDGTRAAVTEYEQRGNGDIWLIDLARGVPTRFTFDAATNWDPVWSPDGTRLAYSSVREGGVNNMYWKDTRGGPLDERIWKSPDVQRPTSWSSDGRLLMFFQQNPQTATELWCLPLGGKAEPYLRSSYSLTLGQFRPEASGPPGWVAYVSNESGGRSEVFVQSFPAGSGKLQVSSGGATQPRWRRDGRELFYIASDGRLMAVEIGTSPQLHAGIPEALFDPHIEGGGAVSYVFNYAVAPDGRRFLVNSETGGQNSRASAFTVVVNWDITPPKLP